MIATRRTKIICTIGPASDSPEIASKLIDAGMNVARINLSHGTHDEHANKINMIRKIAEEKNRHIGIMIDTKGPEVRVGKIINGSVTLKRGSKVIITSEDVEGDTTRFQITPKQVFNDLRRGAYLLIDDGKLKINILEKKSDSEFIGQVYNTAVLKTRKGIAIPKVSLSLPFLNDSDKEDLLVGIKNGVDLVALSFTRSKEDILSAKQFLEENGGADIRVIAKLENQEAIDNLKEIVEVADGVMVARGDLGVETETEVVPIYQKKIIQEANRQGKPVIVATHMLESMTTTPRPTRAEASDVANAVLDGTDAIMLSGETAAGTYPVITVKTMDKIARKAEKILDYESILDKATKTSQNTLNDAIGIAVSRASLTLQKAECIVAFTETGGTARRIAKFRPNNPIVAITDCKKTARQLAYVWGVYPVVDKITRDILQNDQTASRVAKDFGFKLGDNLIITSGLGQAHGRTNTLRIIEIEE